MRDQSKNITARSFFVILFIFVLKYNNSNNKERVVTSLG